MAADPKMLSDPVQLRKLMANARRLDRDDIALACQFRIAELAGQAYDGELEREFWSALIVAEEIKTEQNGKTTRLSRTRQKYARVGAIRCLEDWAVDTKITDGFTILLDAGRPELTGEGIVVRHADKFEQSTVDAARQKLAEHGVDVAALV